MRTLSYEAGRKWAIRVNAISAGPMASRAANAIGRIQDSIEHYRAASPLAEAISAAEVASAAAFLSSHLASGITGTTLYVDKGYHAMGVTSV
jgi:enoyl-[acyl-carrier protein] reductase I